MNMQAAVLAVIGGIFAPLSGYAAGQFTPPAGCDLQMTVQMRSCQVANVYTCAGVEGDRWVSYADGEGEFFISQIDHQTRWIESVSLETGEIDRLDLAGSADHASFDALLATGEDDYDFVTRNNFGDERRYVGVDRLTGEQVTIDGVVLERCAFEVTSYDAEGQFMSRREGTQYVTREARMFFADAERFENALGEIFDTSDAPVTFAFPGDADFGATEPKFGCDMLMTNISHAAEGAT